MTRQKISITVVLLMLLFAHPSAQAREYYIGTQGDDANEGSQAAPFRTMQHAADLMVPDDTCIVLNGRYTETVRLTRSGEEGKPLRFTAHGDAPVTLAGTQPVPGPWEVYAGNIYKKRTDLEFIQLFADGRMMVEARWPNMRFPDELWDTSTWARAGAGSRYGKMVDPKLPGTGIDWTGARATLNVAHQFFTWTRTVKQHTAGLDTFTYAQDLRGITHFADKTKPWEDDYYYLSGKLEALDAPGEWFLDIQTDTLYLWLPDGSDPASHRIEAKVRDYAFDLKDCAYVELEGFHLFGATVRLRDCRHCQVENCHFLYPTYARRIADPDDQEPWADRTLVSGAYNTVSRCSLAYSPASGLAMAGLHNTAEDNLIHDMCWYGALWHTPLHMGPLPKPGEEDRVDTGFKGVIRNNTVYNAGNAVIAFSGQPTLVEYNHVYGGGLCCEDVSLLYTQLPACAGSVIRYNWVHGCRTRAQRGLGIRGDDQTRRLTVHHNVVWDCGLIGIVVKGDDNKVYNNTVFDIGTAEHPGNYVDLHTRPEPKKPWRKQYPLLARQNAHSEIRNNAALTVTSDNRGTPFPPGENVSHNYRGKRLDLAAPEHFDFRPNAASPLVDAGRDIPGFTGGFVGKAPDIGACEYGGEHWKAGITWQPEDAAGS